MGQLYLPNNYYPAWNMGRLSSLRPMPQQPLLAPPLSNTPPLYLNKPIALTPNIQPPPTHWQPPPAVSPQQQTVVSTAITSSTPTEQQAEEADKKASLLIIGGSLVAVGVGLFLLWKTKNRTSTPHTHNTGKPIHNSTVPHTNLKPQASHPPSPSTPPVTPSSLQPPPPNSRTAPTPPKPPPKNSPASPNNTPSTVSNTSTFHTQQSATHPLVVEFNAKPAAYKGHKYKNHLLTETEESINNRRLGHSNPPCYELTHNGNYIEFVQANNTKLLIPKSDLKINEHNLGSIETIFELPPNTKQLIDSGKKLRIQLEAPAVLDATNTLVTKGRFTLVPH